MKDTILTIVRSVLVAIGGALASKGLIESAVAEQVVGGIVTVIGGVWTALAHRKALNTPVPAK